MHSGAPCSDAARTLGGFVVARFFQLYIYLSPKLCAGEQETARVWQPINVPSGQGPVIGGASLRQSARLYDSRARPFGSNPVLPPRQGAHCFIASFCRENSMDSTSGQAPEGPEQVAGGASPRIGDCIKSRPGRGASLCVATIFCRPSRALFYASIQPRACARGY